MNAPKSKFTLLLLIVSFAIISVHSQDLQSVDISLVDLKKKKSRLSREFANIATENTFSAPGNYAAISTADNTLSASLFFLVDNDDVINIKVSSGATQGLATIFDEGELNSNVSIEGSYNFMLRKANNAIAINSTAEDAIRLAIENENRKFQKKMLALLKDDYLNGIEKDIESTKEANAVLMVKKVQADENVLILKQQLTDKEEIEEAINQREAIVGQIEELDSLISQLSSRKLKVDRIKYNELVNVYVLEKDAKEAELKDKISKLRPDAVSFSWISMTYKVTNNRFTLFDETLPLNQQLDDTDYTTHSLFVHYSHMSNAKAVKRKGGKIIEFNDKKREYISLGLKLDYTNNLNALEQVEIIDTQIIDDTMGRTKVEKQNAFVGDYEEDLSNLSTFVDYYNFIATDEAFAIHLNPVLLIREKFKPVTSFHFGILLPFKDKSKQTTTLNLEVFYRIKDLFNTTENENALLNRNIIGIQASFPIKF